MSKINNLPVYEGMSYPAHLKPKTTLYKMGLRATKEPVAITRKSGGQEYFLYAVNDTERLTIETANTKELRYWKIGIKEREDCLTEEEKKLAKKVARSKRRREAKKEQQTKTISYPSGIKLSSSTYKC